MKDRRIRLDHVNMPEALRYMGFKGRTPDPEISGMLSRCERELLDCVRPAFVYKIFELDNNLDLINCAFKLRGRDIKKHLINCEKAALVCVTLSSAADRLIRKKQIESMAQAAAVDAMASALVEQALEQVKGWIGEDFPDGHLTSGFGLGYGDFPVEGQRQFLDVLNAQKTVGVCTSESLLLVPSKSVTCVIGISKDPVKGKTADCAACLKDGCPYRKK